MATEKNTREITIAIKSQRFPRLMLFNRFGFERAGPMRILYFGFVDADDRQRDLYACAIDEASMERQKDDLLTYVGRAGRAIPADIPLWLPKATAISQVEVANVVQAARTGPVAELRLFNYAQGDVLDAQHADKSEVEGNPVALLRCEESIQRAMFLSWYSREQTTKQSKA